MSALSSWWQNVYLFLEDEEKKQQSNNNNKNNNFDLYTLEDFQYFLQVNDTVVGMHVVDINVHFLLNFVGHR